MALTRTEFCSLVGVSRTTLWRRVRREEDGNTVQHPIPKSNLETSSPWEDVVRTWCQTLKYQSFHVAYHTGQMYTVRYLLGEQPPDN